jgi:hypothetical protein
VERRPPSSLDACYFQRNFIAAFSSTRSVPLGQRRAIVIVSFDALTHGSERRGPFISIKPRREVFSLAPAVHEATSGRATY